MKPWSVICGNAPRLMALGWHDAQFPLAVSLRSARPRCSAGESAAIPRRYASYLPE